MILTLSLQVALAADYPNLTYTPDQAWQMISPTLGDEHQNQPIAVNGVMLMAGNAIHHVWDISDPFSPVHLAKMTSKHHDGEAESHQVTSGSDGERTYVATISGLGVDIWDLTTPAKPDRLATVELESVFYGDTSEAVWGISWQGDRLYVGGTNTGIHIVDVSNPTKPSVVQRLPTSAFGGMSAGPLYAIGNLLVVTPPKDHHGVATLDISDPDDPFLLDFEPTERDTYIGGFFGTNAHLVDPFRTFDVTSDPTDIQLLNEVDTPLTEYFAFGDDHLFLGNMRPRPGVTKYALSVDGDIDEVGKVDGRYDIADGFFTDDQFPFPVGNLLVFCDDEIQYGCVIGVHDVQPDSIAPEVAYVNPVDGANNQPPTTRIGVSFSDQIDLRSVDLDTFVVRSLSGDPIDGVWGHSQTVLNFWPSEPLELDTTYEIVLPAGGITDLVGNALTEEFRSVFATGSEVIQLDCDLGDLPPVGVGESTTLPGQGSWDFGDGKTGSGKGTHSWKEPGRYPVVLTVSQGDATRTCAGTQVVHRDLDVVASSSGSVVIDVDAGQVWTVNPDSDTIAAVSMQTDVLEVEVEVCDDPRSLAMAPDGALWVACHGDDSVVVVDAGEVRDRIDLGWGAAPFGVAFDADTAWVSLQSGGAVAIDGTKVSRRVALEGQSRGIAVADGDVYVTRLVSPQDHGEVQVVDGDVIELAMDPGPDSNRSGRGVPNYLGQIVISPDGTRAAVPGKKDNVERGPVLDGEVLDPDNTVRAMVALIDLETGEELLDQRIDLDDHNLPSAALFSPLGDLIFVATLGTNRVDVVETFTGNRVAAFATGLAPTGLALSDDGRLYVQDSLSRTLSVFDVSGLLDGTDAAAFRLGQIPTVSEEPLDESVLLGKQIFHNANSREISQDGYISCAVCHLDGGGDGRVWDFTDRGEGLRNTIDMRGKRGTAHGPVHWTANFDEIQDFENDIRNAFGGSGLLTDEQWELTSDTLGEKKAGNSERLDALADYVASFDAFPRSPFRERDGAMTRDAQLGLNVFERLDCLECHSGAELTDSPKGKRHDVGTLSKTSGQRLGGDLDGLDTPTLYGLWATGPYLHDGSAATLEQVLANPDHGNASKLNDDKLGQLVAFLLQVEKRDGAFEQRGCGCAGSPVAPTWLALIGLYMSLRRRRSQAAVS